MDFLSYAQSLNPAILSLPITGCLNNYDSYNRTVSIQNNPKWRFNGKGFGLIPTINGGYNVANNIEHQISSFSLFSYFGSPIRYNGQSQSIVNVTFSFNWYLVQPSGTDRIVFQDRDNAIFSALDTPWVGKRSLGVYVPYNDKPKFYVNGVFVGLGSLNVFIIPPTLEIIIGNQGAYVAGMEDPISVSAMFPGEISAQNFSDLHNKASKLQIVPHKIKTHYVPTQINSPKVSISGPPNANRIIPDKSGNNHHATASGNPTFSNDGQNTLYNFSGASPGNISVPANSDIANMAESTYILNLNKIRSRGEFNSGRLFSKYYYFLYFTNPNMAYAQYYTTGSSQWTISPITTDSKGLLTITHDRSDPNNDISCQLNGVDLTVNNTSRGSGTPSNESARELQLGNEQNTTRQFDGILSGLSVYNKILSTDEKRQEYLDFALGHVIKYTNRFEHPVTLASVSAPGNVGPYRTFGSNSHQYLDNGSSRYLLHNDIDGIANLQLAHSPYGAFYTKYYFIYNVDLRAVTLGILRRPDLGFVGAQFGYFAYHNHKFGRKPQLWKVQNGALTEIGTSINNWFSDVSQMIEIFLTRRQTDGQFTMWTRDNNHPTWTQYVQGTDNTFTSDLKNLKSMTYADAGNQMQIHDVWSWPYGDSLLPTDVPELADY